MISPNDLKKIIDVIVEWQRTEKKKNPLSRVEWNRAGLTTHSTGARVECLSCNLSESSIDFICRARLIRAFGASANKTNIHASSSLSLFTRARSIALIEDKTQHKICETAQFAEGNCG